MGKKTAELGREQISVWVMSGDLRRADALVAKMGRDPEAAKYGKVTRSTVLRVALTQGLAALEQQYR